MPDPPAIHPSAIVDPSATIGAGSIIGPMTVVMRGAAVGAGCRIGAHVVIHPDSRIGDAARIDDLTVIGKLPMKAALSAVTREQPDLPAAVIGDGCLVGAHVVVYRGASIGPRVMLADQVSVREEVAIGEKTIIGRGVAVENRVRIGARCKIETGAYVTALSEIGDGCFVAPMATFTNDNFMGRTKERFRHHKGVTLRDGARIGANATMLPGLVVGEDGVVAAGSVVTNDVPPRKIVLGTPARVWRDVPEDQLLENQ